MHVKDRGHTTNKPDQKTQKTQFILGQTIICAKPYSVCTGAEWFEFYTLCWMCHTKVLQHSPIAIHNIMVRVH